MNAIDLPIVMECTETLKLELEREVHNLKMTFFCILGLDIENEYSPYIKDEAEKRERILSLHNNFSDECRDNYLRISDPSLGKRYRHLLKEYFAFIPNAKSKILSDIDTFYNKFAPGNEGEKWYDENADTYFGTLLSWAAYIGDEVLQEVERTIDQYDSYLANELLISSDGSPSSLNKSEVELLEPIEKEVKLTWNCKPAVAGYIISELIRAGYIDPPVRHGDFNLKELARTCNQLFDFKNFKPGVDGWRNNVDETRNELTAIPRAKLKLPDIDQLS